MVLVDIHNHCLPGVDDGAKDMDETLQMLRIAAEEGIEHMIVTPHYKRGRFTVSSKEIESLIDTVQKELKLQNIPIQLYPGNEHFYGSITVPSLNEGTANTMAGSNYVLVEYYPNTDYHTIKNTLNDLILEGYYPILAHVERYEMINKVSLVEELIEMGVYIQVNASSVTGSLGRKTKSFIKKLMKADCVHFVGTDAHGQEKRAPILKECSNYITKKFGSDYSMDLLYYNPMMIIKNEII